MSSAVCHESPPVVTPKKDLRKVKPTFKYKPRFGAIVECKDEPDQRRVYDKLVKARLKAKLVRV